MESRKLGEQLVQDYGKTYPGRTVGARLWKDVKWENSWCKTMERRKVGEQLVQDYGKT